MDSPAWMFTKALSHRQKVCRLYKRCLRELHAWLLSGSKGGHEEFLELRYQHVVMRARFEANRDVLDSRKAQMLLAEGCKQLWQNRHSKPFRYPLDPGGSNFDRDRDSSDVILDSPGYLYPEREQFPYYFNRREQRKKEIIEHWKKIEKEWDDEINQIQTQLPKEKASTAGNC